MVAGPGSPLRIWLVSPDSQPQQIVRPVMIVDDDPLLCEFVAMALAEQGYRTLTASDGMEALALVGQELPALILTDVGMPAPGGRDFAARVHELWGDSIPCVIMSGSRPSAEDRADAAVAAYLPKPFDVEELFHTVRQFARTAAASRAS